MPEEAEKTETPENVDALNVKSEHFDPLLALYTPDFKVTTKEPKVRYQNLAALQSALQRGGLCNLNKRKKPTGPDGVKGEQCTGNVSGAGSTDVNARRFLPHQMPIRGTKKLNTRHQRNLLMQMTATAAGPMAVLRKFHTDNQRVRVVVRKENGVLGHLDGCLRLFDKYWNLVLSDVTEVMRRKKRHFAQNKIVGTPTDCTEHLKYLGIELPETHAKSLNRKNVELQRHLPSVMIRGEHIVLISALKEQ